MRLTWKKNKRPNGLAGVYAGPQGSTLRVNGKIRAATTGMTRHGKWYWVAGWESGVPYINTSMESSLDTEDEAKSQALEYVRNHVDVSKLFPNETTPAITKKNKPLANATAIIQ